MEARITAVVNVVLKRLEAQSELEDVGRNLIKILGQLGPSEYKRIVDQARKIRWQDLSKEVQYVWRDLLIQIKHKGDESCRVSCQIVLDEMARSLIPSIVTAEENGGSHALCFITNRFSEFTVPPEEILDEMIAFVDRKNSGEFATTMIEFLASLGSKKGSEHVQARCLELGRELLNTVEDGSDIATEVFEDMRKEFEGLEQTD